MNKLNFALLPLIASIASVGAAHAATVSYTDGDIMLGFLVSVPGNQGVSSDYLVDLGQPMQFTTGSSVTLTGHSSGSLLGNLAADLTSTFGANWHSRTDLLFAIFGSPSGSDNVPSDVADTVYTTNPSATAYLRRPDSTVQSGTAANMGAVGGGYDQNPSTANSNVGLVQSASSANAYAGFQPGPNTVFSESGGISFVQFSPNDEGNPSQTLFFDRLLPTVSGTAPGQTLGTFNVAANGDVIFSAIPEPATMPLTLAAFGLLGVILRPRRIGGSAA